MTSRIEITNPRIIDFYNKHKNMNIERVNLWVIELFEKLGNQPDNDNKTFQEISLNLQQQAKKLEELTNNFKSKEEMNQLFVQNMDTKMLNVNKTLNVLKDDISSHVVSKFATLKNEYLDQMKHILENTSHVSREKLTESIDKCNGVISEKIENVFQKGNQDELTKYFKNMQDSLAPILNTINANIASNCEIVNKIDVKQDGIVNMYKGSKTRGNLGEQKLKRLLCLIYPGAEINETSTEKKSCDIQLMRKNKPVILFENKDYTTSVDKDEVKKFIRDIEIMKCHGIFISQDSPVTGKDHFQIDFHNGFVMIYIHFGNYDEDKVKTAVNIIDHLSTKLEELDDDTQEGNLISDEQMEEINAECRFFIEQKDAMLLTCSDFNAKIKSQINMMEFKTLKRFLSTKYASEKNLEFYCEACDLNCKNLRALKAHKRGAKCKANQNDEKKETSEQNMVIKVDT